MSVRSYAIFIAGVFFLTSMNLPSAQAEAKVHKVVVQVSSDDAKQQELALNNTVNLQKHYGADNVKIEVVAFGPGLSILSKKNAQAPRVESLSTQEITFSACANTMRNVETKTGKKVELTKGVKTTPSGVVRIVELQEQGYSYLRP